jgi:hypothetical protein
MFSDPPDQKSRVKCIAVVCRMPSTIPTALDTAANSQELTLGTIAAKKNQIDEFGSW